MKNFSDSIIEIQNLEFSYKKEIVLKIDKLSFPKNKISVMLGPSGSGKTTLLNLIAGFLKNKNGNINLNSNQDLSFITQESVLYDQVSTFRNIFLSAKNSESWLISKYKNFIETHKQYLNNFLKNQYDKLININNLNKKQMSRTTYKLGLIYKSLWTLIFFKDIKKFRPTYKQFSIKNIAKKEIKKITEKLEIDEFLNKNAGQLSGGQRQRVAFAKAIIKNSSIILMDEPFAALDAKIKEKTRIWLTKIQKQFNLSIVLVTHDQQDAMIVGDYVLVLKDGVVQQFDTPQNLYSNPTNLFVAKFIGYPEINLLKEETGKKYFIRSNNIHISNDENPNDLVTIKKEIGENVYYEVFSNHYKKPLVVLDKKRLFNAGDKVNLIIDNDSVLVFNEKGDRVYA
ncbi:ABC transporter ATP-binding protein [Mycoplasmopsis agassizii]|uniref:ABC transporter ATP-binding protein n=1 Tax=Mycoplasmopsis agassizii TaxID=33922 RepID=A0ABX4H4C1_9BACT|nr:ABC transporter ATP-binding protein [Mycoplasmopsis agassizii]PAF54742.1 ABC transporter ATP-binding protein [Mycoplasmopsis agassizii]SMC15885.1 glycerol ABC transporter ATP-binding protein [Mycoplasmopsis agassizii]